jgi:hypothetical protein
MITWDDGPFNMKCKEYDEEGNDRSDKRPRPCDATLTCKTHKRYQQKVWLPLIKEIWDELDHRTNAITKKEKLLIQGIPKVGKEDEKRDLPTTLGLFSVSNITDVWRQFNKDKVSKEVAEKELKCLWARFQFANGFCDLLPTEGGEYPRKADIEDEYQKRTGRNPQTGHWNEQGQQGSIAGEARDGPSGKSTNKKQTKDP